MEIEWLIKYGCNSYRVPVLLEPKINVCWAIFDVFWSIPCLSKQALWGSHFHAHVSSIFCTPHPPKLYVCPFLICLPIYLFFHTLLLSFKLCFCNSQALVSAQTFPTFMAFPTTCKSDTFTEELSDCHHHTSELKIDATQHVWRSTLCF